jgi:hypothetical protein
MLCCREPTEGAGTHVGGWIATTGTDGGRAADSSRARVTPGRRARGCRARGGRRVRRRIRGRNRHEADRDQPDPTRPGDERDRITPSECRLGHADNGNSKPRTRSEATGREATSGQGQGGTSWQTCAGGGLVAITSSGCRFDHAGSDGSERHATGDDAGTGCARKPASGWRRRLYDRYQPDCVERRPQRQP